MSLQLTWRSRDQPVEGRKIIERESLMMNGRFSAAASIAKHGDRIASVAADSVHHSQRMTAMSQSSIVNKTSHSLITLCVLCLFFSTGCALSKNLLGKSNLQNPALPLQTTTGLGTASPNCAVPNSQPKPTELTTHPVLPQTAAQATANANAVPVNNGIPQQPMMQQSAVQPQQYPQQLPAQQMQYAQQQPTIQQQPPLQQQPTMQQQPIMQQQPAVSQQTSTFVQQPAQPQYVQPMVQDAVVGATQGQVLTAQPQSNQPQATSPQAVAENVPEQDEFQLANPNARKLPTANISPHPNHPKEVGGPEMTAAPVSAFRPLARPGGAAAANCPPGTVPNYGYAADAISSPEKLAECEKQVFEMNQKLNELQFNTLRATLTMEQMAEQQRQLMIDNERLRRRAEMADKRYLEELDSLSEIVGEVVSQTGSGNKSSSASKPSNGANPLRPVPQSATGQSL